MRAPLSGVRNTTVRSFHRRPPALCGYAFGASITQAGAWPGRKNGLLSSIEGRLFGEPQAVPGFKSGGRILFPFYTQPGVPWGRRRLAGLVAPGHSPPGEAPRCRDCAPESGRQIPANRQTGDPPISLSYSSPGAQRGAQVCPDSVSTRP